MSKKNKHAAATKKNVQSESAQDTAVETVDVETPEVEDTNTDVELVDFETEVEGDADDADVVAEVVTTPKKRGRKPNPNKPVKEPKRLPPASRVYDPAILAAAVAQYGDLNTARLKLQKTGMLKINSSPDSVINYLEQYRKQAPQDGSGGYSSFATKEDAFTNQDMLDSFTPQGIVRMLALLAFQCTKIMLGDDEVAAAEIAEGLKGIEAYKHNAEKDVRASIEAAKKRAQEAELEALVTKLSQSMTPAEAQALLAKKFAAHVSPPSHTAVADADETVEDDVEADAVTV